MPRKNQRRQINSLAPNHQHEEKEKSQISEIWLQKSKPIWQPWIDLALTGMANRIRVSVEAAWVHFTLDALYA